VAQENVRTKEAATWVGVESTYAEAATTVRCTPVANSVELALAQTEIKNDDQRVYAMDYVKPVRGLKSDGSGAKLKYYAKPPATQLSSAASAVTTPLSRLIKACGFAETLAAGSTVTAGSVPTTTEFSVTTGHGAARFAVGQWILVYTDDDGDRFTPVRITAIATDTLTVEPALPFAPGTSADVYNMHNFYPDETSTTTVTVEHSYANTNYQTRMLGCAGMLDIATPRNGLIELGFDLKAATWTGPHALALSVTDANDGMQTPWVMKDAVCLVRRTNDTTRTHYELHSFGVKLAGGPQHLPEYGNVEGTSGVLWMPSDDRSFAQVTLKHRVDPTRDSGTDSGSLDGNWYDQDAMQVTILVPRGTGTDTRWLVIDVPNGTIVGKPKFSNEGGRLMVEYVVFATIRASAATVLARAPFVFAIG
jgi:hypothetical protein